MPNYERAKSEVTEMAESILREYPTHAPVLNAKVRIDILMAFGEKDDDGNLIGDAITSRGVKALGQCRVVNIRDRVKGMADAEILLDGDFWEEATEPEQRALLDHELHHIQVCDSRGAVKQDKIGRPKIKMRRHDYEMGLFTIIAQRHGKASQECKQAARIREQAGQFYWPDLLHPNSPSIVSMPDNEELERAAAR